MEKRIFLSDLDNSLFDTREPHRIYVNEKYAIESTLLDYMHNTPIPAIIKKYSPESTHEEKLIWGHLGEHFQTSTEYHAFATPIDPYVVEVLTEISMKYKLIVATRRQHLSRNVIDYLFDKHFPRCNLQHVHFVYERLSYATYHEITKAEFAKKEGIKNIAAFVDDSKDEIYDMHDLVTSHLFDPWDLHQHTPNIKSRVADWKKIGDMYL